MNEDQLPIEKRQRREIARLLIAHYIAEYDGLADDAPKQWYETYEDQLPPDVLYRLEQMRAEETLSRAEPLTEEELREPSHLGGVFDRFAGGWHVAWREPTGFPPGRPTTWRRGAPELVLEELRQAVGFTREEFKALVRRDRRKRTEEEREDLARLGQGLAAVIELWNRSGVYRHLATAYGVNKGTIYRLAHREETSSETKPSCK